MLTDNEKEIMNRVAASYLRMLEDMCALWGVSESTAMGILYEIAKAYDIKLSALVETRRYIIPTKIVMLDDEIKHMDHIRVLSDNTEYNVWALYIQGGWGEYKEPVLIVSTESEIFNVRV